MKLLSIDWDVFFPNASVYDWGHGENNSIFFEMIWSMRANNRSMNGKYRAIDHYVHDKTMIDGFWKKALIGTPAMVFASDSHLDAYRVCAEMLGSKNIEVFNLDAHHDCGYEHKAKDKPDCGNWLAKLGKRVTKATQFYPEWRKKSPEIEPRLKLAFPLTIKHWNDLTPIEANMVFICRSSAWTPPWSDVAWLSFLEAAKGLGGVFKSAPYVERARNFEIMPELTEVPVEGFETGAISSKVFAAGEQTNASSVVS